jgi:hypothetical protein
VGNEMPITKSQLQRINDCLDMISKRMDEMEAQRTERWDSEDGERDITDPFEAPTQPFSDSPPEKMHGEGREDQDFWPSKPKPPIPIEHI